MATYQKLQINFCAKLKTQLKMTEILQNLYQIESSNNSLLFLPDMQKVVPEKIGTTDSDHLRQKIYLPKNL